jgi:hypothetical protein
MACLCRRPLLLTFFLLATAALAAPGGGFFSGLLKKASTAASAAAAASGAAFSGAARDAIVAHVRRGLQGRAPLPATEAALRDAGFSPPPPAPAASAPWTRSGAVAAPFRLPRLGEDVSAAGLAKGEADEFFISIAEVTRRDGSLASAVAVACAATGFSWRAELPARFEAVEVPGLGIAVAGAGRIGLYVSGSVAHAAGGAATASLALDAKLVGPASISLFEAKLGTFGPFALSGTGGAEEEGDL